MSRTRLATAGLALAASLVLTACNEGVEDPPAGPPVTEDPAGEAPGATGEGS